MKPLSHYHQVLHQLRDARVAPQIVQAFGDLIDDAQEAWQTRTDAFFQGAPGGSLTRRPSQALPDFTNYNTSFLAPFAIANTSSQVLPQNKKRTLLLIQNLSLTANLFFSFGSGAGINNGILLGASQGVVFDTGCPSDSVNVFFDSTTVQNGIILEIRHTT